MPRVLLVEDNAIFRRSFKERFRENFPSWLIDEAESGNEALQKIKIALPHLIFMDIRLPDMSGLDLTLKIQKEFPNIRIAVLTSYNLPVYRQVSDQSGAVGFFAKDSLKWEEIEALVRSIEQNGS